MKALFPPQFLVYFESRKIKSDISCRKCYSHSYLLSPHSFITSIHHLAFRIITFLLFFSSVSPVFFLPFETLWEEFGLTRELFN